MLSRLLILGFLGLLCACDGAGPFGGSTTSIVVAQGSTTVVGPPGYCVDRSATRSGRQGSFVLLGGCASISNNASAPSPSSLAVLTASVSDQNGATVTGAANRLDQFFRSQSGRAALARDGNPSSARVLAAYRKNGAFMMRVRDRSAGLTPGLAPDYWRALFDLNGRLVTLTVIAFTARPISNSRGSAILDSFVIAMRKQNPVSGVVPGAGQ